MSLSLSQESIQKAYQECDKNIDLKFARKEKNLFSSDGMLLKIPQDNFIDVVINTIDGRRLRLEKKAEILHDYYGDRLLAKDLFLDYLQQKKYKTGLANLLSIGLIGANAYTRVMKSSVLFGKFGTLVTVLALQGVGRTLSNNWLEKKIERPWKIHTNRLSNGLTATNVRGNTHKEILNITTTFDDKINYKFENVLFNMKTNAMIYNTHFKTPLTQDHYPYAPDEEDINTFPYPYKYTPDRIEKQTAEKTSNTYYGDNQDFLRFHINIPFKQDRPYYNLYSEVVKSSRGFNTTYKPDYTRKYSCFEALKPEEQLGDQIIFDNEYLTHPDLADIVPNLPPYTKHLSRLVNITPERMELFQFHFQQRLKFKEVKKQIAEILQTTGDEDKVNKLLDEFHKNFVQEENKYLSSKIKIINENEPTPKLLFNNEEDVKFYEKYYNNVYLKRPEMTKEQPEPQKKFDFSIDLENYNPWDEYKNIYSGIYKKGKIYWLLHRMPEWRFLQIGDVVSDVDQATNPRNRLKSNMDDSIFNVISLDRYFQERETKEGRYRGRSQSIRI